MVHDGTYVMLWMSYMSYTFICVPFYAVFIQHDVTNMPPGAPNNVLYWLMHGNCGSWMLGRCRACDAPPTGLYYVSPLGVCLLAIRHICWFDIVLSVFVSSRFDVITGLTCSDHFGMNRHWDFLIGSRFLENDYCNWHGCVECRRFSWKSSHATHVQRLVTWHAEIGRASL